MVDCSHPGALLPVWIFFFAAFIVMEDLDDKDLLRIAQGFVKLVDCKELAVHLKITLDEVVREAEIDRDPVSIALSVLSKWKKCQGNQATRALLHAALLQIKRKDLAQSLYPAAATATSGNATVDDTSSIPPKDVRHQTGKRSCKSFGREI